MSSVLKLTRTKLQVNIDGKLYHLSYPTLDQSEKMEIALLEGSSDKTPSDITAEFLGTCGLPKEVSETLDIIMLQELCINLRGQKKA